MSRIVVLSLLLGISQFAFTQELNCTIAMNYEQIPGSNRTVFNTLEKAINEFVNQKKWTNQEVRPQERIKCAMNIIFTKWENNAFEGTLQIQATRPIYNSSYESPILNIRDTDFNFQYNEFDQLIYNPTRFDSNLISTLAFYVYIILGVDADTFKMNGGQPYLMQANNAMLQAQQTGLSTWTNQVGQTNRFLLIDNLLSPNLRTYRAVMYNYHRNGMDQLSQDRLKGKQSIQNDLISLERLFNQSIENYLIRVFFDAKVDEIINLFSDGPKTRRRDRMLQVLQRISPNNSNRWRKIN